MPGAVYPIPTRPTLGQGMVWLESLGGRHEPGALSVTGAQLSGFTDNRIAFGSALGGLEDSGSLTFNGSTLALTGALTVSGTFSSGVATVSSIVVNSSTGISVNVSSTDESNGTNSGSIVTAGGIGCAKKITLAGKIDSQVSTAASIDFWTASSGGTRKFELSTDGAGNGTFNVRSSAGAIKFNVAGDGATTISSTTATTSTTTGALIVAGGIGVAGRSFIASQLYVQASAGGMVVSEDTAIADGGRPFSYLSNVAGVTVIGNSNRSGSLTTSSTARVNIAATGEVTVASSTASTSPTSGALIVTGGAGIGGAMNCTAASILAGSSLAALVLNVTTSGNSRSIRFTDSAGSKYNWTAGAQINVDQAFEITPSTVAGGSTYSTPSAAFDSSAVAGNTRLLIYDVDNAALERVSVGAADSGGAGFKLLRIPN